jgi:hypothetical protein
MNELPLFIPAGAQAWRAYLCSKRQMLVSMVLDEDFATISAAVLSDTDVAINLCSVA